MTSLQNTYIIGDIHGCIHTLRYLLYVKLRVTKEDSLYFLGDFVDRGKNSKAVLDELLMLIGKGFQVYLLRGNHEQMMLDSLKADAYHQQWMRNGGKSTLQSFNVTHTNEIDSKYISLLENMSYYFEIDDFILVHGGLNFDFDNPFEQFDDMMWIRNKEIDKAKTHGKRLIVGHTPVSPAESHKSLRSDIIKLDTGCVYLKVDKCLGYLSAFHVEHEQFHRVENMDG